MLIGNIKKIFIRIRAIASSLVIMNHGGFMLSLSVILNPEALRRVKNLKTAKKILTPAGALPSVAKPQDDLRLVILVTLTMS
jgi:hypothetical protein